MRHPLSLFIIALMTATTVVMGAVIFSNAPVQAQFGPDPEVVALQVYERLPDLPRENQYVHRKRKQVVTDNTLVSRLIRYHTITQGRSPQYRLDWKITLADYLGLNEFMEPREYPGATFLKENPFEQDESIIRGLNRDQRNRLIQAIVDTYDVGQGQAPQPNVNDGVTPSPKTPGLPSERSIDLLAPAAPVIQPKQSEGPAQHLRLDEAP